MGVTDFRTLRLYWQKPYPFWPAVPVQSILYARTPHGEPDLGVDRHRLVGAVPGRDQPVRGRVPGQPAERHRGGDGGPPGGEDFRLPAVLVATANPPGYDPTAKKLSPPLEARIARAYRVSQPPVETMVGILSDGFGGPDTRTDPRLGFAVAAVLLCLWGHPESKASGLYYLSPACRRRLALAVAADPALAADMRALSGMVEFGPDARAGNDWLKTAVGLAAAANEPAAPGHLLATVCEVMANKVRVNFSEGSSPEKVG